MPRISIIVPAYNAEKFLNKCLDSVLCQSFTDWELIIINDGSKDNTAQICDSYAAKDSRIRAIHQKNGGVSTARNRGLNEATGETIAFLDADDWYLSDTLKKLENLLQSGESSSACGNYLSYEDGREVPEAPPCPAGKYSSKEAQANLVLPLLCDRLCSAPLNGYVWRYLFDRSIIEKNHIRFSGAYLEDELFLIEYFCCNTSLLVTDEPLYCYFQNSFSVTKKYLPRFEETFFASLSAKEALVKKYAIPVSPKWLDNTCWAGLLIAAGNEFAPGNSRGFGEKKAEIKRLCALPPFAHALENYKPSEITGNKKIVAGLLRMRAFFLLTLLYTIKNRNRV